MPMMQDEAQEELKRALTCARNIQGRCLMNVEAFAQKLPQQWSLLRVTRSKTKFYVDDNISLHRLSHRFMKGATDKGEEAGSNIRACMPKKMLEINFSVGESAQPQYHPATLDPSQLHDLLQLSWHAHLFVVEQVYGVELLLGAVAKRVDEVGLVGADALGRTANDVHVPRRHEVLDKSRPKTKSGTAIAVAVCSTESVN